MKKIKYIFGAVAISASLGAALTSGNVSAINGMTSGGCVWEFDTTATVPSFTIGPATSGGTCQLTDTDDNLWGSAIGSMQSNYGVFIKTFIIQSGVKAPANMNGFFDGLESVESLDVNNLDVSAVTNMVSVFIDVGRSSSSVGVDELDLSNWDTSSVTDMYNMFSSSKIKKLKLGNNFNTSKVTNFAQMFYNSAFEELTLNFDTTSATEMPWMFNKMEELKTLDIASFAMFRPSPINIDKMFDRMGANVVGGTRITINNTFERPSDAEWAKYSFPEAMYDIEIPAFTQTIPSVPTADINHVLSTMTNTRTFAVILAPAGSTPVAPVNPVTPGGTSGTSSSVNAPNTGASTASYGASSVVLLGCILTGVLLSLASLPLILKRTKKA